MWLDAVVLTILGAFIAMGAARGALTTGMSLLSLFAGYGAAIIAAPRLGPDLGEALGAPALIGVAVAGTLAFAVTFLAMGVVTRLLRRMEGRRDVSGRSARDRFLGGVFGAMRGALVAFLLAYLAIWLDALRVTGTAEVVPSLEGSTAASVTADAVEASVEAALDDAGPAGRVVARMAARPGATLAEVEQVLAHPGIDALSDDPMFWTYVEHGALDNAINQRSFVAISYDDALRARLAELGLIDREAAASSSAFRAAARDVLAEVSPRIRGLRSDPEVRALVEDPEVVAMLQSGNTLGLLRHEGFRRVVSRVSAEQN